MEFKMTKTVLTSLLPILLIAHLGCGEGSRYPGSELAPDESAAIGRVAYTRLAREQACARPDVGGAPKDVESRMTVLRSATEAEIKPSGCKSNIHPQPLAACISEIARWPCAVDLVKVTVIDSCKLEPLCGVPPEGTL